MATSITSSSVAFELSEASLEDIPEIVRIHALAWKTDPVWSRLVGTMNLEDQHAWLSKQFGNRVTLPGRYFFKITEVPTGKMVAYTALDAPITFNPEDEIKSNFRATPPEGYNPELRMEFFARLRSAAKYGFDPKKDYHRRGTMVHPEYQRKGFGKILTKHCNDIADKTGGKTYVVAGPNSKSLFESQGFRVLGGEDIDLTKYGGSAEEGKYWMMMREPCSSGEV